VSLVGVDDFLGCNVSEWKSSPFCWSCVSEKVVNGSKRTKNQEESKNHTNQENENLNPSSTQLKNKKLTKVKGIAQSSSLFLWVFFHCFLTNSLPQPPFKKVSLSLVKKKCFHTLPHTERKEFLKKRERSKKTAKTLNKIQSCWREKALKIFRIDSGFVFVFYHVNVREFFQLGKRFGMEILLPIKLVSSFILKSNCSFPFHKHNSKENQISNRTKNTPLQNVNKHTTPFSKSWVLLFSFFEKENKKTFFDEEFGMKEKEQENSRPKGHFVFSFLCFFPLQLLLRWRREKNFLSLTTQIPFLLLLFFSISGKERKKKSKKKWKMRVKKNRTQIGMLMGC